MYHSTVRWKVYKYMNTTELTTQITKRLPELLPPDFVLNKVRKEVGVAQGRADIEAAIQTPTRMTRFVIEVKNADRIAPIREAAYQVKRYASERDAIPFVASLFLGDRAKAALKDEGVGFFDLAGNFYVKQPDFYAEKVVEKNPFSKKAPLKNLFGVTSSRITRALLVEPKRQWQARELSLEADVSLGQTYNVIDGLIEEEFVTKTPNGLVVKDPGALLDAWKKVYPTYETQRYSFYSYERSYNDILAAILKKGKGIAPFAFGFFAGAGFVAPFIRGLGKAQLYVSSREDVEKLQSALALQVVDTGPNVEIFVPYDNGVFYKQQTVQDTQLGDVPVISNVQLYMDVFNSPARGEEQAEHLRERKLRY